MIEKQNVVNDRQTPRHELTRRDEDWDKQAAAEFNPKVKPVAVTNEDKR